MKKILKLVGVMAAVISLAACNSDSSDEGGKGLEVTPTVRSHSHNDYYRDEPFFGAVKLGFGSFEADVFYREGYDEVLVAHDEWETVFEWSFDDMYIQPLVQYVRDNEYRFYDNWSHSAVLLIDIKTQIDSEDSGYETWLAVEEVLSQYPDIFTTYENGVVKQGPVTAIISGHRPIEQMDAAPIRYSFVDGRLGDLGEITDPTLMPLISNNFSHFNQPQFGNFFGKGEWPQEALDELERIVTEAHANNQKIRFWATPEGNDYINNHIWSELVKADVDFINTDHQQDLHDWLLENDPHPSEPSVNWLDDPFWEPMYP
ncbi:phosphatidylinositol-specific phospholipase C/glycerophosphodiester phosphodiesterase family protein [Photobacterium rosenbergii]|uniref:phosphatidylinositol-specific phospholipase C/glycerophosphodiester phosphodiesterase family protein n=1 Tax=Photobacterium rosenbergii TaxID=294936 RepID=UPI001F33043D|nr:phosphatidylinositol-specific phospholipase C/glycerophosphodiester phosphodiesterase family protein [Photobacterium rosenbergii]